MQILVLVPEIHESEPDNQNTAVQFALSSAGALIRAGYTVHMARRQRTQDTIKLQFVTEPQGALSTVAENLDCSGPLPEFDLLLAYDWTSIPLIQHFVGEYFGHIMYFSAQNTFLPNEKNTVNYEALQAEASILSRATWCVASKTEYQEMQRLLPTDRLLEVPPPAVASTDHPHGAGWDRANWQPWIDAVISKAQEPIINFAGQYTTVQTTLRKMAGSYIWFENVFLPGSVHLILQDDQGRYGFIKEVRPEQPEPIIRVLSGSIKPHEKATQAAQRELLEETGLHADQMELLWQAQETGTVINNRYYFIVKNYTKVRESNLEPGEDIRGIHFFTVNELAAKLRSGAFGSSYTALALHKLCGDLPTP